MCRRRAALRLIVALAAVAAILVPARAEAQSVGQAEAQVARILARIDQLGDQANRLNEQRNGTRLQLEQAQAELADAQQQLADLDRATEGLQSELRTFLVRSYVAGGDTTGLGGLLDPAAATASAARAGYAQALTGASSDAIENYQAAVRAQAQRRSEQAAITNRIADATTRLGQTQAQIEALLEAQRTELDKAKGDLAAAVAAEQKRRAEEAARRSREEAAAAAARLAAQQQAAADAARQQAAARVVVAGPASPGTTRAPVPVPSVPAASPRAAVAVRAALSQLGVPYVFASMEPGVSFDCSGLTKWAWSQAGVGMSHFTGSQLQQFPAVAAEQVLPGDLVFPDEGHVGIYLGNGQMIHAPRTGDVVKISPIGRIWAAVRPG
jgi:cell wall-associated NlpC family hydrolase